VQQPLGANEYLLSFIVCGVHRGSFDAAKIGVKTRGSVTKIGDSSVTKIGDSAVTKIGDTCAKKNEYLCKIYRPT